MYKITYFCLIVLTSRYNFIFLKNNSTRLSIMLYGAPFLDHAFSSDMLYAMLLHAVMQSYNSEDKFVFCRASNSDFHPVSPFALHTHSGLGAPFQPHFQAKRRAPMAKRYQTLVHTKGSFLLDDKLNLRIGKVVSFLSDKRGKCLFLIRQTPIKKVSAQYERGREQW